MKAWGEFKNIKFVAFLARKTIKMCYYSNFSDKGKEIYLFILKFKMAVIKPITKQWNLSVVLGSKLSRNIGCKNVSKNFHKT